MKFVKSLAGLCIPNYPDQNLPTIFVYLNGELKRQFIGTSCFTSGLKQDGDYICLVLCILLVGGKKQQLNKQFYEQN